VQYASNDQLMLAQSSKAINCTAMLYNGMNQQQPNACFEAKPQHMPSTALTASKKPAT
jgi:hypothetical protein